MADTGRTVFADGLWADGFWAAGLWAADAPVSVPDVVGLTQAAGTASIQGAGLVVAVATAYSSTVPAGTIISQVPTGGASAALGSTVTITVSLGDTPVTNTQSSGGYWHDDLDMLRERRRRAKKKKEAREAELEAIAEPVAREIASLLRQQEADEVRADELARLQRVVDRFRAKPELALPERVDRAMQKAFESRTQLALEQFYFAMEQMASEEEAAVILALLLED